MTGACVLASVLTLALVALERGYGVLMPLRAHVSPLRHPVLLAGVWVIALVGASPFAVLKQYKVDHVSHTAM